MTTTTTKKPSFLKGLTGQILIAMFLGAILGVIIHNSTSVESAQEFSNKIKMLTTIFIRLVQLIIEPLVFTTLVVGIAKLGDVKTVGRIGGKALAWFFTASFISLLIGMLYVNLLQPGVGLNLSSVNLATSTDFNARRQNLGFVNFSVRDVTGNRRAAKLVLSMIALAHNLGIVAIAEGVEDRETADLLADMGCDFAQGYFYGRPKPAEEFIADVMRLGNGLVEAESGN